MVHQCGLFVSAVTCLVQAIAFFSLLCLVGVRAAVAITIDEFSGEQSLEARPAQGTRFSSVISPFSLGGTRGIEARVVSQGSPNQRLLVDIYSDILSHSQDSSIAGYSILSWDGDDQPAFISLGGLGQFDLLQDGGNSFRFEILQFDLPSTNPVPVIVKVYDGSNPSRASSATLDLSQAITTPTVIDLPFANLSTASGASAPADLRTVGAITVMIDSRQAPAADLQLSWLGTNGQCRNMPNSQGRVIDQCNVCAGDGTSCLDCLGVPFGTAQFDRCNVCAGDGNSCLGCSERDVDPILAAMDGGAKFQEGQIKALVKLLYSYSRSSAQKVYGAKVLKTAHALQVRNWTIAWQIPSPQVVCTNTEFCTASSNLHIIREYLIHNNELRDLARNVVARISRLGRKQRAKAQASFAKIDLLYQKNIEYTNQIDLSHFRCAAP